MLGKPKYKVGQMVEFMCGENDTRVGEIYIVDRFGTFSDPTDVSYDIMVESENCLYKHITESLVIKKHRKTFK